MEFLKKLYCDIIDKAFGDPPGTTKYKITKDKCTICEKTCNKRCPCRCHVPSCRKCDEGNCEYKKCDCKCHIPKEKSKMPIKKEETQTVQQAKEQDIYNELFSPEKGPAEKMVEPIKPETDMSIFKAPGNNPSRQKIKNFVNKLRKKSDIPNPSSPISGPLIKFKSKVNKVVSNSQKAQSVINELKTRVAQRDSSSKNKLNSSYHSNNSVNSKNTKKESFNILKNPLTFATIKKRVENMKFKDLTKKLSTNNYGSKYLNISSDNVSVDKSLSASPIPPNNNKNHLKYSFDLNNSRLYHGKSSVAQRMEDVQRQIVLERNKSEDVLVGNLVKGFEKQDAWQMYNSILFADPSDLPDASALKKVNEKVKIINTKQKQGAITSTTKKK